VFTLTTFVRSLAVVDGLTAAELTGIRRLSALDTVRARIALAVELGLLSPGDRLPPNAEIARALGVGEITVRRALVSLCTDGVLERKRGRGGGTLVAAEPSKGRVQETADYVGAAAEVGELIDRRLVMECGLVHLAAARGSSVAPLHDLVDRMEAAPTWADFHALDASFHLAVAGVSGLPAALASYQELMDDLYGYFLPYPIEFLRGSNQDHANLVESLAAQDPVAAVAVTRRHVAQLHQTMLSHP
jgi:GntR family transcriptional repressor for pyruvate dehydrogenase complex